MRKKVDDNMYYIGLNIRAARRFADLTQEQLSERLGITPQHLSEIERGLVGTSIPTLVKLCKILNVSADFILFGNAGRTRNQPTALIERMHSLPDYDAGFHDTEVDILLDTRVTNTGSKTGSKSGSKNGARTGSKSGSKNGAKTGSQDK